MKLTLIEILNLYENEKLDIGFKFVYSSSILVYIFFCFNIAI